MGVGGKCHACSALPLRKTWYSLYGRLGGPQSRSGWVQKISPPQGFDPRTIQPLAIRYTDYSIPAFQYVSQWKKIIELISSDIIHHYQNVTELWHIIFQTALNFAK
jgi:hypothetical protein